MYILRPDRKDFEETVGVALLRAGVINRFFARGVLDEINLGRSYHVTSLDYARVVLLHLKEPERPSQHGMERMASPASLDAVSGWGGIFLPQSHRKNAKIKRDILPCPL